MAKMIPEKYDEDTFSYGERQVFQSLKSLPDEYTVFHSVKWNDRNEKGRIVWGEADFTILHPVKGILVIEVKSGGIECNDQVWTQIRTDNGMRSLMGCPLSQAGRSKYEFIKILRSSLPNGFYCMVEQAVWFPSVSYLEKIGELPPFYAKEIVLSQEALAAPQKFIDKIYAYYNSAHHTRLNQETVERIIRVFAPQFKAFPGMQSKRKEAEYVYHKMTREQSVLLDYLEEQAVAAIQGNAGTGKTMLALEKARRLSDEGQNVLFLCFNRYLYEFLARSFPIARVTYTNLYALTCKLRNSANVSDAQINELLNHYDRYDWNYKSILVDEGQDFQDDRLISLQAIAEKNQGCFYVFYDKNQLVQQWELAQWLYHADCRLVLNRNCRNSFSIAATSCKPIQIEPKLPETTIMGTMPEFHITSCKHAFLTRLSELIAHYLKNGFGAEQICVLTIKTEESSLLYGQTYIGKHPLTDTMRKGCVQFSTVRKFKGLESDIVILIDIDAKISDLNERRLFYTGASRAKHYLNIVFCGDDKLLNDLAAAITTFNQESNAQNPLKIIATGLKVKPKMHS
ncbi:MAG: ATP-binding domain-containing protein [Clostridiales Family XIII bacterium]|jgi:hypothetical protein|nr:ATP-binding domain-containing protein [Clostridiales Family XIII bacterium]